MGPIFNFNKKEVNKTKELELIFTDREGQTEVSEILIFFLLNLLSSILEFLTVGFRRVKHEKCSTRRGLRVGTKNTGFHREFK